MTKNISLEDYFIEWCIRERSNATVHRKSVVRFLCVTQAHQRLASWYTLMLHTNTLHVSMNDRHVHSSFQSICSRWLRWCVCVCKCDCECMRVCVYMKMRALVHSRVYARVRYNACMCTNAWSVRACVFVYVCWIVCFRLALLPLESWYSANKHFYSTMYSVSVWTLRWYDDCSAAGSFTYKTYKIYIYFHSSESIGTGRGRSAHDSIKSNCWFCAHFPHGPSENNKQKFERHSTRKQQQKKREKNRFSSRNATCYRSEVCRHINRDISHEVTSILIIFFFVAIALTSDAKASFNETIIMS